MARTDKTYHDKNVHNFIPKSFFLIILIQMYFVYSRHNINMHYVCLTACGASYSISQGLNYSVYKPVQLVDSNSYRFTRVFRLFGS